MKLCRPDDLVAAFADDGRVALRSSAFEGSELLAPAQAVPILAFCTEPRSREEVTDAFGPGAGAAYDVLARGGVLLPPERAGDTPGFFAAFSSLDMHRRMLADRTRVDAYAAAIQAAVTPTSTVLDAGTGTGVLAGIAATSGARRVYAVDNAQILESAAERVIAASGLDDRVSGVPADLTRVKLDERVDLIITETFGALALAEGGIHDVTACCENNLADGGRVIPSAVTLRFAPVVDISGLAETPDVFDVRYGVDLRPLRPAALGRGIVLVVPPESLGHPGAAVGAASLPGVNSLTGGASFDAIEGAALLGWAGWFTLHLWDGVDLPTGPADPLTHWKQTFLPIDAWPLTPGQPLALEVAIRPAPGDRRGVIVDARWTQGDREGRGHWKVV